jgi:3-mercaptopyruvate sulfurtransferase SseA
MPDTVSLNNDTEHTLISCTGSSNGRGPRCAGWFAEYVATRCQEAGVPVSPEVFILEGGIKGWVAGGEQYTLHMDDYQPNYWRQLAHTETGQGNGSGRKRVAEVPAAYKGPVGVMLDERTEAAKRGRDDEIVQSAEDMVMS